MVTVPEAAGIVLVIEYDGRNYHGSQYQANARTIQGELEKALHSLTGKSIRIKAAGRTDAGVHARGQVVSFGTDAPLPLEAYVNGLNHFLPEDISVKAAYRTARPYDVRRRAVSRVYRYCLYTGSTPSPLRRGLAWRVEAALDVKAMQEACRHLVGRHDFASFVASAETARTKNTVRDMMKAEITQDGDTVALELVANAFLPHQVRAIVGALVKVGRGKMTAAAFGDLVAAATPGLAGPMAPADGLYLEKVNYPGPFEGEQE